MDELLVCTPKVEEAESSQLVVYSTASLLYALKPAHLYAEIAVPSDCLTTTSLFESDCTTCLRLKFSGKFIKSISFQCLVMPSLSCTRLKVLCGLFVGPKV